MYAYIRQVSPAACPWTWPRVAQEWLQGTELEDVVRLKMTRLDAEIKGEVGSVNAGSVNAGSVDAGSVNAGSVNAVDYREACALVTSHLNSYTHAYTHIRMHIHVHTHMHMHIHIHTHPGDEPPQPLVWRRSRTFQLYAQL